MTPRRYLKTAEEVREDLKAKLKEDGFNVNKGSIALLFASIISSSISLCYSILEKMHLNCFVSSADRTHLEKIASSNGVIVPSGLSDDKLRYLIVNSVAMRGSMSPAILRTVIMLSDENIIDIKFKHYVMGAGSVCIYIHTKNEGASVLSSIRRIAAPYIPAGTVCLFEFPKKIDVRFKINIFASASTLSDELSIKSKVSEAIAKKLSTLDDTGITMQNLIDTILSADDSIKRAYITDTFLNDIQTKVVRISAVDGTEYVLSTLTEINF